MNIEDVSEIQSDEQNELMYMQHEYFEFKASYRRLMADIELLSPQEKADLLAALIESMDEDLQS